ncbi:unnamed protein product [Rotaria sp. Silwood1]|nr:unnamed protein product [Rotaria sp. Silwood1]CAF3414367.1 unnamed protein product [Rotaria sp. Silwood1]CAF5026260.1 unnamed protein product [Rotaria sp. Silwood1]
MINKQIIDTSSSEEQHNHSIVNASEDSATLSSTINTTEGETEPLLGEYQVEPSSSGLFLCSKLRARYAIAIWAFFGFFCLYAMRVNLSVAIVAMVSKLII